MSMRGRQLCVCLLKNEDGKELIFNPFFLLLCFDNKKFSNTEKSSSVMTSQNWFYGEWLEASIASQNKAVISDPLVGISSVQILEGGLMLQDENS